MARSVPEGNSSPPAGQGSGEDIVDEELREEQNAEDETVAARQRHAVFCRPLTGQLATQGHQVPAGKRKD